MVLAHGQVQVRDLVMGEGTDYRVLKEFNPFAIAVRTAHSAARAWNHGSWSGVEWAEERVVPIRVAVGDNTKSQAEWLTLHQQLMKAFAPIGEFVQDIECRFTYGGTEYVLFGRPRMVESEVETTQVGWSYAQAAFVALDPRIYSGTLHTGGPTGLPVSAQGLTIPSGGLVLPMFITGKLIAGELDLVNAGTTDTSLFVRIDGPAVDPGFLLRRPDGTVQSVRMNLILNAGQWLDIDTAAGTVFQDGNQTSGQRGRAFWDVDPQPLQPGTNILRFLAVEYNEQAMITTSHRDAWW